MPALLPFITAFGRSVCGKVQARQIRFYNVSLFFPVPFVRRASGPGGMQVRMLHCCVFVVFCLGKTVLRKGGGEVGNVLQCHARHSLKWRVPGRDKARCGVVGVGKGNVKK